MGSLKTILKPFIVICSFLLPFILFLMILRLANGNTPFFGLNDFVGWLEQQDFYNPIQNFIDFVNSHNELMRSSLASLYNTSNFFDFLGNVFKIVGIATGYLSYPVVLIYNLINMFVDFIVKFYDLIKYAIELRA